MKKRRWIILGQFIGIFLLMLVAVIGKKAGAAAGCFFLLLIRCIFLSREGGALLRELRAQTNLAVRQDRVPEVSLIAVIGYTAMICSPFYCFWALAGLLGALVGTNGWLVYAFPTVFLSAVSFKMVSAAWAELGVKKLYFWGLQLAAYVGTLIPMMITVLM